MLVVTASFGGSLLGDLNVAFDREGVAKAWSGEPIALNDENLKAMRALAGLSQSELAGQADVPVRTIQQYEQRQKDINKAQAETLLRLACALNCNVEDLMEKVPPLNFK